MQSEWLKHFGREPKWGANGTDWLTARDCLGSFRIGIQRLAHCVPLERPLTSPADLSFSHGCVRSLNISGMLSKTRRNVTPALT